MGFRVGPDLGGRSGSDMVLISGEMFEGLLKDRDFASEVRKFVETQEDGRGDTGVVIQACKPGEPPALRKVKIPHNGKTSMNRSPLAKQEISSQFSSCFERIGCFPGDPCKFHLKPDHQPARHASKKQGIPEEVNEHADWVHSTSL